MWTLPFLVVVAQQQLKLLQRLFNTGAFHRYALITVCPCRPVGRVGLRGIPLLALENFRYHTLNALLFVSSPLASPPLRITAVQASLVAAIHPACSRMTSG